MPMHKVPSKKSLLFEILTEDDDKERGEKLMRSISDVSSIGDAQGILRGRSDARLSCVVVFQDEQSKQENISSLVVTPRDVLSNLLNDLYVDADSLRTETVIGEGGFATVYRCTLLCGKSGTAHQVAMKVLKPDLLSNHDDLKEFITEANLQRKLKHRNIVRSIGVGASDLTDFVTMHQSMYFVQEYMNGGSLKEKVLGQMLNKKVESYSVLDGLQWLIDVANALHYLHAVCRPMIIHRDLKLENILLTGDPPVAKICDFGLHKRLRNKIISQDNAQSWPDVPLTNEGSYYGGTLYHTAVAEEQETHMESDASSTPTGTSLQPFMTRHSESESCANDPKEGSSCGDSVNGHSDSDGLDQEGRPDSISIANQKKFLTPQEPVLTRTRISPTDHSALRQQLDEADALYGKTEYLTQKVGSMVYMAPEVTMGDKYNEKVDVFSFGVIMYEVLAQSVILVKRALIRDDPDLNNYSELVAKGHREEIPSYWPDSVRRLVEDCWSDNPAGRPAFHEIIFRLLDIQNSGVIHALRRNPSNYNAISDCGCCTIT